MAHLRTVARTERIDLERRSSTVGSPKWWWFCRWFSWRSLPCWLPNMNVAVIRGAWDLVAENVWGLLWGSSDPCSEDCFLALKGKECAVQSPGDACHTGFLLWTQLLSLLGEYGDCWRYWSPHKQSSSLYKSPVHALTWTSSSPSRSSLSPHQKPHWYWYCVLGLPKLWAKIWWLCLLCKLQNLRYSGMVTENRLRQYSQNSKENMYYVFGVHNQSHHFRIRVIGTGNIQEISIQLCGHFVSPGWSSSKTTLIYSQILNAHLFYLYKMNNPSEIDCRTLGTSLSFVKK